MVRKAMGRGCVLLGFLALGSTLYADPLKFPVGPSVPGRFGAYYTQLQYGADWDKAWRVGPAADVVVRFDRFDARLIFWRGTSYVPCWVSNNRQWYTDGSVNRPNGDVKNDTLCRYSHATIAESNDARVVIHWKYAILDSAGKLINTDPMTNWNDWVDEFYTIYPDGVGVRQMTLYSSAGDQPFSNQQSTLLYDPGKPPGEVQLTQVATAGASVQVVDLPGRNSLKPFDVVPGDKVQWTKSQNVATPDRSWPLTGTKDPAYDQPSSLILGRMSWEPSAPQWQRRSWTMMVGLVQKPDEAARVAQSWIKAPPLAIAAGSPYADRGYNLGERAYELACMPPGNPGVLNVTLPAVHNVAFILKGWGTAGVALKTDGERVNRGHMFRYGYRKTTTESDLIIWLEKDSDKPVTFELSPVSEGQEVRP
jgi:hypothetical protein